MDKSLEIHKIKRHFLLKKSPDALLLWHFPKLSSTSEQLTSAVSSFVSLDKANSTVVVDGSLMLSIYIADSDRRFV